MPDIIRLLPESVANQIAAGEVIQRPASAVKELLENSIDAGATEIKLIIKDSGRNLIQVIDNGCGMSATDARMSFERHATSKIKEANDLFAIRTFGFRGEALASIAAIAKVSMKTRRHEDELGTIIEIEGAHFISQSPCSSPAGTSIAIKNLFYNVPARRNFLKSNQAELRHVIEEFQRVALVHHNISFSFYHQEKPVFVLQPSGLKQRIIALMGNHFNNRLLTVEQDTPELNINGYIGKPEFARRARGEQFFFVNGRFIRNPYLNHAVETAFMELIPEGAYPVYFLYLKVDPAAIDVNIHPTKTEINFQHSQLIYATIKASVRQALGRFSLSPQIDFETENSFNVPPLLAGQLPQAPTITINPRYNPFGEVAKPGPEIWHGKTDKASWKTLLDFDRPFGSTLSESQVTNDSSADELPSHIMHLAGGYILAKVKSGLMIIDQYAAHQRILFDQLMQRFEGENLSSQQSLFPHQVSFSPGDAEIIREIEPLLKEFGFVIEPMGLNTFVVNGMPSGFADEDPAGLLESIVENYRNDEPDLYFGLKNSVASVIARRMAVKPDKILQPEEMTNLINELFSCQAPEIAPDGSATLRIFSPGELFNRS